MKSLLATLLALGSLASVATGQFWPTVTTTTNMGTWSTYNIANLTNGTGLSAMNLSATHSATWQEMWMSNSITTGWIQFDLGSVQPVSSIAVWNYNSSISTARGVALMDVSWSLDGIAWFPLSQERPPRGTTAPIPPHVIPARGIPARYIKFDVLQNYGTNYTGLSEVQFVVGSGAQTLTGSPATISIASGGTHTFSLDAGATHANRLYWIFGSVSGTSPGVTLPSQIGSVLIPLNPDVWTNFTITFANSANLPNTRGALDGSGKAQASLIVPVINDPNAVGVKFHHAYLTYDASGNYYMASNPVELRLTQ
jgi:hypothetical protein